MEFVCGKKTYLRQIWFPRFSCFYVGILQIILDVVFSLFNYYVINSEKLLIKCELLKEDESFEKSTVYILLKTLRSLKHYCYLPNILNFVVLMHIRILLFINNIKTRTKL